ncbi:MAG TPA: phage tail protein [Pyrinomonadaceae bacterium]|nr:phage tail protein [Pyrinomonadaceae bacterium]
MADDYPFVAFRFDVQLLVENPQQFGLTNPLCNALFSECDGLEMTMEPKTVREGGNNLHQTHLPGPVTYGQLTLKRGMTGNLDLWKWFNVAAGGAGTGRGTLASGLVTLRDGAGTPKLRFNLVDCLPVKIKAPALSGKDGIIAVEEMQLAYASFTVEAA